MGIPITGINIDVGSVLTGAGQFFKDIRAALTGKEPLDANKAAELALKAQEMENGLIMAQAEINKIEAANPSLFVSGWRPGVGWVCVLALAYTYIGQPFVSWGCFNFGWIAPPSINMDGLMTLLLALLGVAGLRTYEKKSGVAAK
jgi:hypothetical protein